MTPLEPASGAAGRSDPGLTRPQNEDAILIEPPLYAVADGMGGHRAGEIASRIAVEELLASAPRRVDAKALARAVRSANRAVIESAEKSRTRTGMGTTITAAMVDGTHVAVAHVGDSRAYLFHHGLVERITEDHSMVADLVRQGSITEQDARFHPQRSVITRALGSDANMVADVYELDAEPGDRLLLTTDGLTGMLDDDYIAEILASEADPDRAADKLVEAANRAGGYDNISLVIVELQTTPAVELAPVRGSHEALRRISARLLWVAAAVALVLVASWGAWSYAQSRAYIVNEGGYVSLYRGIPGSFAGVALHWRLEATDIPVVNLEIPVQTRLRDGIAFESVTAARTRVDELRASVVPTASPSAPASSSATTPTGP
jgi:serine/threonine protein phosphatase PrpC